MRQARLKRMEKALTFVVVEDLEARSGYVIILSIPCKNQAQKWFIVDIFWVQERLLQMVGKPALTKDVLPASNTREVLEVVGEFVSRKL